MISPTQRPLPENTRDSKERDIHPLSLPTGFEPAIPASERSQTHALDRAAPGIGTKQYFSVSVPVTGPVVAHRVGRGIALLFHDRGTRRSEWSASRPGRTLPPEKTRYPLYRRLGGPKGRSGRTENLAPPGFDPRTVQPVVSRYTD